MYFLRIKLQLLKVGEGREDADIEHSVKINEKPIELRRAITGHGQRKK